MSHSVTSHNVMSHSLTPDSVMSHSLMSQSVMSRSVMKHSLMSHTVMSHSLTSHHCPPLSNDCAVRLCEMIRHTMMVLSNVRWLCWLVWVIVRLCHVIVRHHTRTAHSQSTNLWLTLTSCSLMLGHEASSRYERPSHESFDSIRAALCNLWEV